MKLMHTCLRAFLLTCPQVVGSGLAHRIGLIRSLSTVGVRKMSSSLRHVSLRRSSCGRPRTLSLGVPGTGHGFGRCRSFNC